MYLVGLTLSLGAAVAQEEVHCLSSVRGFATSVLSPVFGLYFLFLFVLDIYCQLDSRTIYLFSLYVAHRKDYG